MRRIDALFLKHPFYGARQMVRHLRREGVRIGRRRAGRLLRRLGLQVCKWSKTMEINGLSFFSALIPLVASLALKRIPADYGSRPRTERELGIFLAPHLVPSDDRAVCCMVPA